MELKINREAFDKLDRQLQEIKAKLGEGLRGRELLAAIYRENMPDKNDRQAERMAAEAMESVENFYRDLDRVREDKDAYIDSSVAALLEGKSLRERCETLKKLLDVLTAMHSENLSAEERQALGAERSSGAELPDEITPQTEADLTLAVKDLMGSYTFMAPLMPESADILSALTAGEDAEMLVNAGWERMDYLAALTMLAYVNLKNGMFPDAPEEISLRETGTVVCAASETLRAAGEAKTGWAETALYLLLSGIGTVVAIELAVSVVTAAVTTFALPMGILGQLSVFFICYCGIKVFSEAVEWWIEDAGKLAAFTVSAAGTVLDGLKTMAAFAKNTLLPAALDTLKAAWVQILSWLPLPDPDATERRETEETETGRAQTVPEPAT